MKTGMMAVTKEISKIDLYLKEPIMSNTLKLAIMNPEEAHQHSKFGIFTQLKIDIDKSNILLAISKIHRKL